MGMTTSGKNAEDVLDMCAILFGAEFMENHAVVTGNCNGNSPLVWDETMLSAMRAFNRRNQPVLCSPFVLGGANTPASTAPAVAQLNAEALSALAYTQVSEKVALPFTVTTFRPYRCSPAHRWQARRKSAS